MMNLLSKRVLSIEASATSGTAVKAKNLKAKGVDVISFSQGEPDFKTPPYICEAAKQAIDAGNYFSYPPTGGYLDLRTAIAQKYVSENKVPYKTENIVVTNGAKQALSNVMLSILNPGDEVLIFAPFWVSYLAQVKLAGAKPIIIKGAPENDFKVGIQQIKDAISTKTKAIVFSSPCNPTGLVYNKQELEALAELVSNYPNLLVIADEIYEHINYTPHRISFAALPGMFNRTITINGFSKCYAMTGWRVGYLAAPTWLSKEVIKLQGHLTSSNSSIAQRAAFSAINNGLDAVNEMVQEYQKRRDLVYAKLNAIAGIEVNLPSGAFYIFPNISKYYGTWYKGQQINNSIEMCTYLLEIAHIAVVPGAAFGEDACVRISYASPEDDLLEGLKRLKKALGDLEKQKILNLN